MSVRKQAITYQITFDNLDNIYEKALRTVKGEKLPSILQAIESLMSDFDKKHINRELAFFLYAEALGYSRIVERKSIEYSIHQPFPDRIDIVYLLPTSYIAYRKRREKQNQGG